MHHVNHHDHSHEHKQATAIAQRFLTALDSGNGKDIMKISSVPFWGDGDYIVLQSKLESVVNRETARPRNEIKNHKASHVIPIAELEAVSPRMYRKLKQKMDLTGLHIVFLAVETVNHTTAKHQKMRVENAVILVKKDTSNHWTVVGIED